MINNFSPRNVYRYFSLNKAQVPYKDSLCKSPNQLLFSQTCEQLTKMFWHLQGFYKRRNPDSEWIQNQIGSKKCVAFLEY